MSPAGDAEALTDVGSLDDFPSMIDDLDKQIPNLKAQLQALKRYGEVGESGRDGPPIIFVMS